MKTRLEKGFSMHADFCLNKTHTGEMTMEKQILQVISENVDWWGKG